MRIFAKGSHINFMAGRKMALVFSSLLVAASFASLATKGLNFGIDFTGGTLVEVTYAEPVELAGVRSTLAGAGFKEAIVQHFGTPRDVLVRVAPREGFAQDEIGLAGFYATFIILSRSDEQVIEAVPVHIPRTRDRYT